MTTVAIGYWLMKPTVLKNPGVAAYQPPAAAKVLDNNSEARLIAAEAAATAAANKENRNLGLAANASVAPNASVATRSAVKHPTIQRRLAPPRQSR